MSILPQAQNNNWQYDETYLKLRGRNLVNELLNLRMKEVNYAVMSQPTF